MGRDQILLHVFMSVAAFFGSIAVALSGSGKAAVVVRFSAG
jgi:hypothetical protein